jgi:hypothetical protein
MIRSPQNVVLLIRFDAISNDHLFCVWAKPIPSENGGQQNPQGSSACRTKKNRRRHVHLNLFNIINGLDEKLSFGY